MPFATSALPNTRRQILNLHKLLHGYGLCSVKVMLLPLLRAFVTRPQASANRVIISRPIFRHCYPCLSFRSHLEFLARRVFEEDAELSPLLLVRTTAQERLSVRSLLVPVVTMRALAAMIRRSFFYSSSFHHRFTSSRLSFQRHRRRDLRQDRPITCFCPTKCAPASLSWRSGT